MAVPAPASAAEAMDMVLSGLRNLAATDPTALAAEAQAECLRTLEHAGAISTAARARFLAAFTAGQGYCEDADYSPTAWLIHRTRITKGAARGHLGWARRDVTHPRVVAALAEGTVLSESMAGLICCWTDKLPEECHQAADAILIAAGSGDGRHHRRPVRYVVPAGRVVYAGMEAWYATFSAPAGRRPPNDVSARLPSHGKPSAGFPPRW